MERSFPVPNLILWLSDRSNGLDNLVPVTDPSAGVTTDESILCPRTTAKKLNPLAGAVVNVRVLPAIV